MTLNLTFGQNSKKFSNGQIAPHPLYFYLLAFEADLFQMITDVEFDSKRDHLQRQLKTDINLIRSSDVFTVPADKNPSLYEMDTNQYRRLLQNNVTTTYKKSPTSIQKPKLLLLH